MYIFIQIKPHNDYLSEMYRSYHLLFLYKVESNLYLAVTGFSSEYPISHVDVLTTSDFNISVVCCKVLSIEGDGRGRAAQKCSNITVLMRMCRPLLWDVGLMQTFTTGCRRTRSSVTSDKHRINSCATVKVLWFSCALIVAFTNN